MPEERLDHSDVDAFFNQQCRGRVPEPVRGQVRFNSEALGQRPQPLPERGGSESTSFHVEEQRRGKGAVFAAHLTVTLKLLPQSVVWDEDDPLLAAFAAHEDLAAIRRDVANP